jgi:hypothetical protein
MPARGEVSWRCFPVDGVPVRDAGDQAWLGNTGQGQSMMAQPGLGAYCPGQKDPAWQESARRPKAKEAWSGGAGVQRCRDGPAWLGKMPAHPGGARRQPSRDSEPSRGRGRDGPGRDGGKLARPDNWEASAQPAYSNAGPAGLGLYSGLARDMPAWTPVCRPG